VQRLTDQGWQKIVELSGRYGVSTDAVMSLLQSVVNGNGTMAQFSHPELGGGGQWMQGGMTMVGDMFNYGLKSKVDGLCSELSQLLAQQPFTPPPASSAAAWQSGQQQNGGGPVSLFVPGSGGGYGSWWPAELGSPNGTGGQNNVRYAYFSNARRLAVDLNGHVTVYDTLDHQIGGVSQQQGYGGSLTLSSQYGTVDIANLPVVSVDGAFPQAQPQQAPYQSAPAPDFVPQYAPQSYPSNFAPEPQQFSSPAVGSNSQETDIFAKIERLAELQQKGILSQEEFASKKSELLSRI
jgi:hypothetical protein